MYLMNFIKYFLYDMSYIRFNTNLYCLYVFNYSIKDIFAKIDFQNSIK